MHLLRGVRQEGRQQGVDVGDHLQRGVQHGVPAAGSSPSFHGSVSERYLFAAPATRIASPMASLNRLRPSSSPTVPNAPRAAAEQRHDRSRAASPGVGMAPLFLCAMEIDRLTRLPHSLASSKLVRRTNSVPGEVGVGGLRPGHGDEVAQRVRPELAQEVADVDHPAAAGGELRPAHGQELAGDDLVRAAAAPPAARPRRRDHRRRCGRAGCPARSRCGRRCCPCP